MAAPENQIEPQRYLRDPKVVFVKPLDDGRFLVTDLEGENEYVITKEVLDREYVVLY